MALLGSYPSRLVDSLNERWQQLLEHVDNPDVLQSAASKTSLFYTQLMKTWAGSDFAADVFISYPNYAAYFLQLFNRGQQMAVPTGFHHQSVKNLLADVHSESELIKKLRVYRNREMVRIIWRDLNRLATTQQTTTDLSALADACIQHALDWLYGDMTPGLGTPYSGNNADPEPQQMVILGMGKLGANELNLSSDIDLIFTFPNQGETAGGRKSLTNQEFFTRLGQRLIKVLDCRTAEGFVFRVDMRLRPYGSSGALVMSFAAMEQYYQDQGRDWERYAMIKARAVAGDTARGNELLAQLKPFVYRRYIDFSAITSLRDMKHLIEREVKRKGMENNIKLGPGGIREIEFIAQSFQLIHGGRDPVLRQRALLTILPALAKQAYMPETATDQLKDAYLFLRNVEHAIQAVQDQQTQELPKETEARTRLALVMDCASWDAFMAQLNKHRRIVSQHFADVVGLPESPASSQKKTQHFRSLWMAELDDAEEINVLQAQGFSDPDQSLRLLSALRDGRVLSRVRRQSRERVDRFMPLLLEVAAASDHPDTALNRLLPLVEAVLRRTAYLVLLMENPAALEHLCKLCVSSPWIADLIARNPALLDEFLNLGNLYSPPKKDALADELRQQLAHIPEDDLEAQMEALRYFKMSHVLRVTAAHVVGKLPLMKESDYLTWIAEAVLEQVVAIAWRNLTERHGRPQTEGGGVCGLGFIIIGYGKLGGIELGPGSDLDLVFVHNGVDHQTTDGARPVDSNVFYARLGQRIIHILTTQTLSGALYEVDMRLRPSGASGLLVNSFRAYEKYQHNDAWTWEHQALVRARVVAGDSALAEAFTELRASVLRKVRDPETLRKDVTGMRQKMQGHSGSKGKQGQINLKQDKGGIIDIEFLMQYAVLRYSPDYPELVRWTDNIRISEQLEAAKILSHEEAHVLRQAYQQYRLIVHKLALQNEKPLISHESIKDYSTAVKQLWKKWLEN
ncbi:bifunctional [glutamate--ammonia ligase]-adenylyl-L-tyrosine phosphorylase/[glutamate--ammonia-ligase] adenylyltransferase [Candidatus Sororendozoicomonas aggregata]|uniref:bifunctional [glutamate--ammonia ligase]-adenylyl-L-tyrosine phosphorylase/[glutamate--ammonia-ligase] adenylyltransferase n=1 Tax=Candidatus Sororendozoicomonas aggregata TaxID=3073239 RepID=UPI002ED195AB